MNGIREEDQVVPKETKMQTYEYKPPIGQSCFEFRVHHPEGRHMAWSTRY